MESASTLKCSALMDWKASAARLFEESLEALGPIDKLSKSMLEAYATEHTLGVMFAEDAWRATWSKSKALFASKSARHFDRARALLSKVLITAAKVQSIKSKGKPAPSSAAASSCPSKPAIKLSPHPPYFPIVDPDSVPPPHRTSTTSSSKGGAGTSSSKRSYATGDRSPVGMPHSMSTPRGIVEPPKLKRPPGRPRKPVPLPTHRAEGVGSRGGDIPTARGVGSGIPRAPETNSPDTQILTITTPSLPAAPLSTSSLPAALVLHASGALSGAVVGAEDLGAENFSGEDTTPATRASSLEGMGGVRGERCTLVLGSGSSCSPLSGALRSSLSASVRSLQSETFLPSGFLSVVVSAPLFRESFPFSGASAFALVRPLEAPGIGIIESVSCRDDSILFAGEGVEIDGESVEAVRARGREVVERSRVEARLRKEMEVVEAYRVDDGGVVRDATVGVTKDIRYRVAKMKRDAAAMQRVLDEGKGRR